MRTKRAFCFVPEIAGLSECQSAEASAQAGARVLASLLVV